MTDQSTRDQLKQIIERVERLEDDKADIAADIKEVYAEAKSRGFDTKAIKAIIRIRKQDENARKEAEAVLDTYMHALGMLDED